MTTSKNLKINFNQTNLYLKFQKLLAHNHITLFIFRIQMFYGTYRGDNHGGLGGQLYKIRMYHGDRIVRVTGRAGAGPGTKMKINLTKI